MRPTQRFYVHPEKDAVFLIRVLCVPLTLSLVETERRRSATYPTRRRRAQCTLGCTEAVRARHSKTCTLVFARNTTNKRSTRHSGTLPRVPREEDHPKSTQDTVAYHVYDAGCHMSK